MRTLYRILLATGTLLMVVGTMLMTMSVFQGKYVFRPEPELKRAKVDLPRKPLSERSAQNAEFCLNALKDGAQKQAYEKLREYAFYDDSEQMWLDGADKNDFQIALTAFLSDHPEVFWIEPAAGYRYSESDDGLTVELNFTSAGSELNEQRGALESAVETAVKGAPDNANDYEVELYLNDYLSENCEYDMQGENKHSAFGALAEGTAVCDGYSHAFQLLCQRLGIDCTVVEGSSDFNESTDDGHMWNCVKLGDSWYHVDPTWNDSSHSITGAEHYFYLNLTTDDIVKDHQISGSFEHRSENKGNFFNVFVPDCDSDELNYMKLNFVEIKDPEDDEQIMASLLSAARSKESFCAFLISEDVDFDSTCENIINNYGGVWIQGANHYMCGDPRLSDSAKAAYYAGKRVLAFNLTYV